MVTNLAGQVVGRTTVPIEDESAEAVVETLCQHLAAVRKRVPARLLPAIGIGVPGLVDERAGVIRLWTQRNWQDVPIRAWVEAELHAKVFVMRLRLREPRVP